MASNYSQPEPANEEPIRQLLRHHGLRYSRPREAILELFREGHSHIGAEEVQQALREKGEDVSLSTVYLNLGVLREAGVITEFRGANGQALYDHNVTPHLHIVCKRTGRIIDVPNIEIDGKPLDRFLKERVEEDTGWSVEEARLELAGTSPEGLAGEAIRTQGETEGRAGGE